MQDKEVGDGTTSVVIIAAELLKVRPRACTWQHTVLYGGVQTCLCVCACVCMCLYVCVCLCVYLCLCACSVVVCVPTCLTLRFCVYPSMRVYGATVSMGQCVCSVHACIAVFLCVCF